MEKSILRIRSAFVPYFVKRKRISCCFSQIAVFLGYPHIRFAPLLLMDVHFPQLSMLQLQPPRVVARLKIGKFAFDWILAQLMRTNPT